MSLTEIFSQSSGSGLASLRNWKELVNAMKGFPGRNNIARAHRFLCASQMSGVLAMWVTAYLRESVQNTFKEWRIR